MISSRDNILISICIVFTFDKPRISFSQILFYMR
jgi:hypothetical protein